MSDRFRAFDDAFLKMPLIAILRGLEPGRAGDVAALLAGAGFTLAEVPLNGPSPFEAIEALKAASAGRLCIGAGTVLTSASLSRAQEAGAQFVVAPNFDQRVGLAARADELPYIPGVLTPTEAFRALDVGATALKLFPAESASPRTVTAWRQVMPPRLRIVPVGGISLDVMAKWWEAGASGFGLGGTLFRPATPTHEIGHAARQYAAAMTKLTSAPPP